MCLLVIWSYILIGVCEIGYSYMLENNRKFHNQFDTEASASKHSGSKTGKDTFRGVSTFADGYTVPPNQVFLVSYDFLLAVLN